MEGKILVKGLWTSWWGIPSLCEVLTGQRTILPYHTTPTSAIARTTVCPIRVLQDSHHLPSCTLRAWHSAQCMARPREVCWVRG